MQKKMLREEYNNIPQKNTIDMLDYKKIVSTAILAGEIMLESNAETYRVEDVMNRILKISNLNTSEAIAITTGLFVTLEDPSIKPISRVKRITTRTTNLNRIAKVNTITRRLTSGACTVDEAYTALQNINEKQYNPFMKDLAISMIPPFFAILLGGGIIEFIISWVNGIMMILSDKLEEHVDMGFFIHNVLYSATMAAGTSLLLRNLQFDFNADIVITSSIMPLVPGTAITNALRDTLRGDYMSSGAKALEAVVIAISIAVGVAIGLLVTGGAI